MREDKKTKKRKIRRSSITGRFVPKGYADQNPQTTQTETVETDLPDVKTPAEAADQAKISVRQKSSIELNCER